MKGHRIEDPSWHIVYTTNITNDVLGHLSDEDVDEVLAKIERLK